MRRSEIRETIFRLLFMKQFNSRQAMDEQISVYLDDLRSGVVEEKYSSAVTAEDEAYIRDKLGKIMDRLPEIDDLLNHTARGWKTTHMGSADLSALRLAVYEIRYDPDIPDGVAINEAVELAKRYGEDNSGAFVNGILGEIVRRKPEAAEDGKAGDAADKADTENGKASDTADKADTENGKAGAAADKADGGKDAGDADGGKQ